MIRESEISDIVLTIENPQVFYYDYENVDYDELIYISKNISMLGLYLSYLELNGIEYEGYEIHMGQTTQTSVVMENENVYGTYIHGLFDTNEISNTILKAICNKKGVEFESLNSFDLSEYKNRQYDKLADVVREGLNIELIYRIVNKEI